MTPAARVSAAIEILDQIIAGEPAEKTLTNWARGARYAGSKDRRAVRDHVFDALRQRASCARLGGAVTGRGVMLGLLRAQGANPASVFTGERHAPAPLSYDEESHNPASAGFEEQHDWPEWLQPQTERALGEDLPAVLHQMQHRAPVWLRINPRVGKPGEIVAELGRDGISVDVDPDHRNALKVTDNERKIASSSAYQRGAVELQDRASQWAIAKLPYQSGGRVLDYCAGGGGKSLAIASQSDVQVFAYDISTARMKDLPARAARAGVDVRVIAPGKAGQSAPFDLVLVDAPCSGSGTWRRTPDQKWKLTPQRLSELTALQSKILDEAAVLVATDGALAYATCSFFRAENEDQIDQFRKRHRGWQVSLQDRQTPLDGGDGFGLTILTRV